MAAGLLRFSSSLDRPAQASKFYLMNQEFDRSYCEERQMFLALMIECFTSIGEADFALLRLNWLLESFDLH